MKLARFLRTLMPGLGLSLLLTFSPGCGAFTKEVAVPTPPVPCVLPAHHVQADCGSDIPCLLTEFALTVQADQQVDTAASACKEVVRPAAQ